MRRVAVELKHFGMTLWILDLLNMREAADHEAATGCIQSQYSIVNFKAPIFVDRGSPACLKCQDARMT